jgi:small nuclear ribonucleoprotein (snRNP)-like protein
VFAPHSGLAVRSSIATQQTPPITINLPSKPVLLIKFSIYVHFKMFDPHNPSTLLSRTPDADQKQPPQTASTPVEQASSLLSQYLGRTLRVHTDDKRVFVGQMKCTDRECNIVLGLTQEYRQPPDSALKATVEKTGDAKINIPFTSRYVGLVVVPGKYITKIEQEEYIGGR